MLAIIGLLIYSKKLEAPKVEKTTEQEQEQGKRKKKNKEGHVEDLLGFKTIDRGVITLPNGYSLRAVLGVSSIHYNLLSETEQRAVDGVLASVLASLSFSIQPISITRPVDLNAYVSKLRKQSEKLTGALKAYAEDHIKYLDEVTKRQVLVKQDYLVVGVDSIEDVEKAKTELDRRCGLIISGLRRAGLFAHVLDTQEVADIFYDIFHSNRVVNARIDEAIESGETSYYVKGNTVPVIYAEG